MTQSALTNDLSITLEAAPSSVFRALTEAVALSRWFAAEVSIEARVGGLLCFSGRGAIAATSTRITRFEPERCIAFSYPLYGVAGEVTLSIAPEGQGQTKLDIQHRFVGLLPVARGQELVDDLWRLAGANLAAHLRGGEGVLLPDFTDPQPEVRVSLFIAVPPSRVYRALLDPKQINAWLGMGLEAVVEPRVGGRYFWTTGNGEPLTGGPTRILDLVEDERLVLEWPDWRGDPNVPHQRVAWTLTSEHEGTRLVLVHDGFSRAADVSDYPNGWWGFMERLRTVAVEPGSALG